MDPRVAKTPYSVYDAVKTRRRTTSAQLKILESVFVDDKKPLASTRKQLAELLHMSHREVQVWFQNRRAKEKAAATPPEPSTSSVLGDKASISEPFSLSPPPPAPCLRAIKLPEAEIAFHEAPSIPVAGPDKLDSLNPTLSSWLDNMSRLSDLVEQIQHLAESAPAQHRRSILSKVSMLRTAYKKQQERCVEFLQLSEEYADRYLKDIEEELQSQGDMLRKLEQRLKAARDLRAEVIVLQSAFKKGTCAGLKSIRKSVRSIPCRDDVKLFQELDTILCAIQACYKELDKFWISEVVRVTKTLNKCRVDKEDIDRLKGFQLALEESMSISETVQPNNCIETHPDNHPLYPSFSSLPKKPPLSSESGTQQRSPSSIMPDDVDTIPLKIILGMASAKIKLSALRSSSSIKLVDQALEKRLVDADFCLRRNRCHYAEFLERCIEYGGKAISRSSSSHLRPVFPRSRRAGDLRLQGRTILSRSKQENDSAGLADIVSDAEWTKNRKVLKAGRLLQKIDQNWQALCGRHATVFAKLISLESSNPYPAYTVKQLSKAWRKWTKESEFLRIVMARLGAERPLLRLL